MNATAKSSLLRVLIVDDCADSANTLALLLHLWGHETCTAEDGLAALEVAESYEPDVVVLDLDLPCLDGWEVARRLRQQTGLNRPVLVVLTGYGEEADRLRAKEIGIDYFFVKPVELQELQQVLAAAATENCRCRERSSTRRQSGATDHAAGAGVMRLLENSRTQAPSAADTR